MAKIYFRHNSIAPTHDLKTLADRIINECQSFNDRDRCYKNKILNLTLIPSNIAMEDAFTIIDLIQQQSGVYMNCHDLAHKLGGDAVKKDPDRLSEVISQCPTMMCSSGCSHGALVEKYKADSLSDSQLTEAKKELADVCMPKDNWHPSSSGIYNCHHGLGHLSMYITRANIPKSIQICEEMGGGNSDENYTETCIGGVFMTIFQPLDRDDSALIAGIAPQKTKDGVDKFCNQFTNKSYHACHRESWIYFWDQIQTPEGFEAFCGYSKENIEQLKCYSRTISPIASNFALKENNLKKMADFCSSLTSKFRSVCFANAARRIIQINVHFIDKAVAICGLAAEASTDDGEICYKFITDYGHWIYDIKTQSEHYKDYCSKFPSNWENKCMAFLL